jgi:hypothetical protein
MLSRLEEELVEAIKSLDTADKIVALRYAEYRIAEAARQAAWEAFEDARQVQRWARNDVLAAEKSLEAVLRSPK